MSAINSKWVGRPSPKSLHQGSGWFGELNQAWTDGKYAVMSHVIQTDWGEVTHACIRNTGSTDVPWAEKQRIKNELFGVDRVAIEVFPTETQLVDEANMYHIWIMPKGFILPFTIKC